MGKEKRTPHRADGADNHGGTPYARPSARGGRGRTAHSGGTGLAGRGDLQASNNSLQGLAEDHGQRDRPEQTSIWRSLVSTPLRALKSTYTILSGSPNDETGAQPKDGAAGLREESSTAAVIADGPLDLEEKVGDRTSLMGNESMTSQPDRHSPPPSPQGASPAISQAPGTRGDRGSEYDSIRAQSASLMVQTPISSSPFLNRRKPGLAQSSGAQLGHALGPPGRLSLGPGNLSRFAQLEASPMSSPLALTPVMKPQRTTPRASRPFGKTPLRLPSGGGSGEGLSDSPVQEPETLAWTPMRAAAMTPQTGGLRGFGLKRMREGEGTPGTPLLAAGHASEAARRIRQRSDQAVDSAERRVWRAGATPFPGRPGSAGGSPSAAGPAPSRLGAPHRDPVPMTESARRIAQALDTMTKQNASLIAPSRSQPGPPPTHTLGAFPASPATSQGGQRSQQKPLLLGPSAGSLPPGPSAAAAPPPAAHAAQQPAASSPWGAAQAGAQHPQESEPPSLGLWGQFSQPPGASSGSASTSSPAPSWGRTSPAPDKGAMDTPKFTFRPSRPLSDSAEKLRQQLQRQKEGGKAEQSALQREQAPAAGKAAALNAKAAEAAAQPLPDSEDSDNDELGDVKGIMRTGPQKENGAFVKKPPQETLPTAAPATGGWGADFLKQNAAAQASASAAAQKEIEEKHAGKAANAMPSFGKAFAVPAQGAEKSVPGKSEPAPVMGWGADFLKKTKESEAEASAAAAAAIEEAQGAAKGPPASSPWTFGKPAPDTQSPAGGTSTGLLGFLGSIAPGAAASGFAPSTSSGFGLSSMPSSGAAAAPASFLTGGQGSSAFPALKLPSADGKAGQESIAHAAQTEDGPVKKKRGRGGDDTEADGAPPSKGFNFGAAAPAFGAASTDSKMAADASKIGAEVSVPPGGLSFGASQPFSFGAAAAAGSTAAERKTGAKESQPGQENADSSPAAALVPASLAFGTRPAEAASDGRLDATAKPFAPTFGAGSMPSSDISGVQKAGAGSEAGNAQSGPASIAASGLPLIEGISGRSIDSNMSISPVAGSASAANNPFTSADEAPPQPTSSGAPLANPFLPALPTPTSAASVAAPSAFLFGATAAAAAAGCAPAQDAAPKLGLLASSGIFGASGSAPAFGGGDAPVFGSVAKAPASEQGSGLKSGTPAFGLGNGPASGSGFSFGASSGASLGAQSSPAFGTGVASATAPSARAAPSTSGFTFGGSAPLAFGAGSAAAAGAASAAAPAFGAPQQTAGALFGTSAPATAQQPAWNFAFGASQPATQSAPAPAFGTAPTGFGAGSTPAFGSAPAFGGSSGSAPAFGAMPAFGAQSAPAFGAQSAPAFGAQSTPAFGGAPAAAPASGFAFGGAFGAGQKQDGPAQAQPPFGSTHNQPAFGQAPAFGAQPSGQAANPFAQPGAPAFGGQQQPPAAAGNGGFPAPGGGLAGNSAGSMTLGVGEQKQGGGNMARRKYKLKRSGGK